MCDCDDINNDTVAGITIRFYFIKLICLILYFLFTTDLDLFVDLDDFEFHDPFADDIEIKSFFDSQNASSSPSTEW